MVDLLNHETTHHFPLLAVAVAGDAPRRFTLPASDDPRTLLLDMSPRRHCGFWASQLDGAVGKASEPILLVAEGLSCLAIARWALLSPRKYVENIAGAYLFAPLHYSFGQAVQSRTLQPSPQIPLPFPSLVIDSRLSPVVSELLAIADSWGSRFIDAEQFAKPALTGLAEGTMAGVLAQDVLAEQP